VTVRCGALAATHLGLGALAVRRGAHVAAGQRLGAADQRGVVRLGARIASRRFAYLDPLTLLGPDPVAGRPLAPASRPRPRLPTLGRAPRSSPARRLWLPRPRAERPSTAHGVAKARVPALAWLGVAALAAGIGAGGLARRRRGRRAAGRVAGPGRLAARR
jgi:hypothetical protein